MGASAAWSLWRSAATTGTAAPPPTSPLRRHRPHRRDHPPPLDEQNPESVCMSMLSLSVSMPATPTLDLCCLRYIMMSPLSRITSHKAGDRIADGGLMLPGNSPKGGFVSDWEPLFLVNEPPAFHN